MTLSTVLQPGDSPPAAEQEYFQEPHLVDEFDRQSHPPSPAFEQAGPSHWDEPDSSDSIGPPDQSNPLLPDPNDEGLLPGLDSMPRPSQAEVSFDRLERPRFDPEPSSLPTNQLSLLKGSLSPLR